MNIQEARLLARLLDSYPSHILMNTEEGSCLKVFLKQPPEGHSVEILCKWDGGRYILEYLGEVSSSWKAQNLKEALEVFREMVENYDFYKTFFYRLSPQDPSFLIN